MSAHCTTELFGQIGPMGQEWLLGAVQAQSLVRILYQPKIGQSSTVFNEIECYTIKTYWSFQSKQS